MTELQNFIDGYGFGISVQKLAEKAYRHTYLFSKSRKHGRWIAKAF